MLKFCQRFYVQDGQLPDVLDADVAFGSYLPTDKNAAVQHSTQLLGAKAISLVTATQILVEAGFPVADAATELARIVEESQQITVATMPPQLQEPAEEEEEPPSGP